MIVSHAAIFATVMVLDLDWYGDFYIWEEIDLISLEGFHVGDDGIDFSVADEFMLILVDVGGGFDSESTESGVLIMLW